MVVWWDRGRDNTTSASSTKIMQHTRSVPSLAGRVPRDWALETFRQTSPHFRKMPKLELWNCRKRLVQEPVSFLILFLQRAFRTFRSDYFSSASGQTSPPHVQGHLSAFLSTHRRCILPPLSEVLLLLDISGYFLTAF